MIFSKNQIKLIIFSGIVGGIAGYIWHWYEENKKTEETEKGAEDGIHAEAGDDRSGDSDGGARGGEGRRIATRIPLEKPSLEKLEQEAFDQIDFPEDMNTSRTNYSGLEDLEPLSPLTYPHVNPPTAEFLISKKGIREMLSDLYQEQEGAFPPGGELDETFLIHKQNYGGWNFNAVLDSRPYTEDYAPGFTLCSGRKAAKIAEEYRGRPYLYWNEDDRLSSADLTLIRNWELQNAVEETLEEVPDAEKLYFEAYDTLDDERILVRVDIVHGLHFVDEYGDAYIKYLETCEPEKLDEDYWDENWGARYDYGDYDLDD